MPDLEGPLVEKWEQWYASRPDYVARMVDRSRRYLYHIVTEVTERGMPTEIALLPMIESAYNPVALSTSRAAGIWQFIPSTGKHYGLKQDFWVDSRRDVLAATDKALEYLSKLHDDFGDWQLALAGYNWGEGNVAKGIARNKAKGLPTDYESLAMPAETRNYLPKLQAVKNIVRDPEKYGLALADIPDAPFFAVVKTNRKMDTKRAAEFAEMPLEDFLALNPQHNRPVIAGADEQSILLPIDNAEIFAAKLELVDQPLVSWQAYRMRPNETLPQVAAKYGMSVETLRAVNGIGAKSHVPAGHPLLVPAQRPSSEAADTLDAGRVHRGSGRPHVLLHGQARRHAAARRRPLRRDGAGTQVVERLEPRRAQGGPGDPRHQRRRAGRAGGRQDQARRGDARREQAGHRGQGGAGEEIRGRDEGQASRDRSRAGAVRGLRRVRKLRHREPLRGRPRNLRPKAVSVKSLGRPGAFHAERARSAPLPHWTTPHARGLRVGSPPLLADARCAPWLRPARKGVPQVASLPAQLRAYAR